MKFTFILVGKLKENYFVEAVANYRKMLQAFGETEVIFIEETSFKKEPNESQIKRSLDEEAEKVLARINQKDLVIVCDLHGKMMDSISLAKYIEENKNTKGNIKVVIGSSYGLSDKIRARGDLLLKLSEMTFLHPMTLIIIMEQIYRANKIMNNQTYHK